MRVSKTILHAYSCNRFIYHAHWNYVFHYGRMTRCEHNLNTTARENALVHLRSCIIQ